MSDCASIDRLVTPYVDGSLGADDREAVAHHLDVCKPCRARVVAEQAVRDVVQARGPALRQERAPGRLRARCCTLAQGATRGAQRQTGIGPAPARPRAIGLSMPGAHVLRPAIRVRLAPSLLVAALVLAVGGAFVSRVTQMSARVMAAELAADHVKCFALNAVLGTHQSAAVVEASLASSFGWTPHLPEDGGEGGLELIGSRPCLYGEGRVAHIMYRHQGEPVSLFMLPRETRSTQIVSVLGHQAAIWCVRDRTFVLVARGTRSEVEQVATFIRERLR